MDTNPQEVFLGNLEAFNRKERFYLLKLATEFELCANFLQLLGSKLGLSVPTDAFFAMDYHLDWLAAAVALQSVQPAPLRAEEAAATGTDSPWQINVVPDGLVLGGNQRDMDFLLAFDDGSTVQLILLEAKADTNWKASQLDSKADRLTRLFGASGDKCRGVQAHLVLVSPKQPSRLDTGQVEKWPEWFCKDGKKSSDRIAHIELFPETPRYKPTRCDKISPGSYERWKVERSRSFAPNEEEAR